MSSQVMALAAEMSALHIGEPETVPLVATFLAPFRNGSIKNQGSIKQLLHAVLLSYKTMKLTIESLEQGKLSDFDPLVSDCACQMRALFVALYVTKILSKPSTIRELSLLKAQLDVGIRVVQRKILSITPRDETRPAPRKNMALADVLNHEGVELQGSSKLVTLAYAFLLTKTKSGGTRVSSCADCNTNVSGFQESTDYEAANVLIHRVDPAPQAALPAQEEHKGAKVKAKAPNRMKTLVDAAKIALSKTSCELIQDASCGLDLDPLAQLLLKKVQKVHGRDELPCYATCQVVFKMAMKENIPVLLKVRKARHLVESLRDPYDVTFLLKPIELQSGAQRKGFIACRPTREDMNKAMIVVEGQRCGASIQTETTEEYAERLGNENFMDLIAMNAGAHKQYSADGIQIPLVEEIAKKMPLAAELLLQPIAELSERAQQEGCMHNNQKLFAITHIFCDTLRNQLIDLGVET